MFLTRHATPSGPRWAADGKLLQPEARLKDLLGLPQQEIASRVIELTTEEAPPADSLLAPVEPEQEIWASGVTYLRSRVEREAESSVADVYAKVYEAERPELFFKSVGWRAVGPRGQIRIRRDSTWNVPEPELTLAINSRGEIVGYTVGNDVSSRSIEGENPLYLPQAKSYDGACAVGPGILLADRGEIVDLPIHLSIVRGGETIFEGDASTSQMKRTLEELVEHLVRETAFPGGVLLMTGTCIVPGADFTLLAGDVVHISVGTLTLSNEVASND